MSERDDYPDIDDELTAEDLAQVERAIDKGYADLDIDVVSRLLCAYRDAIAAANKREE